ncbi:MAG: elongation factor P [Phaeodactylibacter sp.]|nr:elongation factor P [Phaeodactylibacter sp.]
MASTSDIRKGLCIKYSNDIYSIVEFQHVKPGKGAAFVRTKLKSLSTGRVIDNTFPSGHKIETVRVERRKFQYLYKEEMGYCFMDNETFEQIYLQEHMIGNVGFLLPSLEVEILFNTEESKPVPLQVDMPQYIIAEIIYTEPGVKGDTATNTLKPAKIETEAEIKVPLFINEGDKVKIETETGNYMERVRD